jgi:hypothetical protein
MATKAVHPFPDRLPADRYTSFGEQVLDNSRAEREAVVDPNRIGDDLAWEAVTFQAGHGGWSAHRNRLDSHETPNKLAMPMGEIARTKTPEAEQQKLSAIQKRIKTLLEDVDKLNGEEEKREFSRQANELLLELRNPLT